MYKHKVDVDWRTWERNSRVIRAWLTTSALGQYDHNGDDPKLIGANKTTKQLKAVSSALNAGKLRYQPVTFSFDDASDALRFKLAWGGKL